VCALFSGIENESTIKMFNCYLHVLPFDAGQVMHASALRIDELLSAPDVGALSFVVMVPHWLDPVRGSSYEMRVNA
jgi:hypothetical protein